MQIEDDDIECINLGAMDIEKLRPEAKEHIKQTVMLDHNYTAICTQISSGGTVVKENGIHNEILCWKNRLYVPEGLGKRVTVSEYDSKVAGHFGRERILELFARTFYWPNLERGVRN